MSAQRLRRWSNIVQMLCKCLVFTRMYVLARWWADVTDVDLPFSQSRTCSCWLHGGSHPSWRLCRWLALPDRSKNHQRSPPPLVLDSGDKIRPIQTTQVRPVVWPSALLGGLNYTNYDITISSPTYSTNVVTVTWDHLKDARNSRPFLI